MRRNDGGSGGGREGRREGGREGNKSSPRFNLAPSLPSSPPSLPTAFLPLVAFTLGPVRAPPASAMAFTHSFNINDWETLRAWRRGREGGKEG